MDTVASIRTPGQVASLASEPRLRVLRLLMSSQMSLSELGRTMGKHAAWVRYHVKELEKSGLVRLVETRKVRNYVEHIYRATSSAYAVHMLVAPEGDGHPPLVVLGSHDLALEMLADTAGGSDSVLAGAVGSLDGLIALRQGLADVAGCHLLDTASGTYNEAHVRHLFPDRHVILFTLAHREQGLFVAKGNPLGLSGIEDIARPGIGFLNRNPGSGTRLWLDNRMEQLGIAASDVPDWDSNVSTHTEAAAAVAFGRADASLGIRAAATRFDVDFVPLFHERYDLVVPEDKLEDRRIERLLERLGSKTGRTAISRLGGYDTACSGAETAVGF